eukprot:654907-Amphidinium_carterae.3
MDTALVAGSGARRVVGQEDGPLSTVLVGKMLIGAMVQLLQITVCLQMRMFWQHSPRNVTPMWWLALPRKGSDEIRLSEDSQMCLSMISPGFAVCLWPLHHKNSMKKT